MRSERIYGDEVPMDVEMENGTLKPRVAASWRDRLVGLLDTGPDSVCLEEVLCLVPCKSIHTFGMRYPIDIVFVGKEGEVLESERNLGANKIRRCPGACWVGERRASPGLPWPEEGDRLLVSIARSGVTDGDAR